jgi:formylglycine-generating enzyme required for sulfatase activity
VDRMILKRFLPCLATLVLLPFLAFSEETPSDAGGAPTGQGIAFVTLHAAGDSFVMGDGTFGPGATETFSADFALSKYLVTNSQYAAFVNDGGYAGETYWTRNGWAWKGKRSQPAYWTDPKFSAPDQPVVGVSWYEAVAFCNWLSAKDGLAPAYDADGRVDLSAAGYRLPTEVEWEYGAAKGAPGENRRIFPWGDKWDPQLAVCQVKPASAARSARVGSRSPDGDTPQGLVDMAGNVWEWTTDNDEGDASIRASTATDRYHFHGDSSSNRFVLRGGSWVIDFPAGMRASFRSFTSGPGLRYNVFGFRIAHR